MFHLGEAVFARHARRPLVETAVAHLLDLPADAAGEVMVVTAAAEQERELAVLSAQRVGHTLVGQALEVAVDGGESDALESAVQLLSGEGGRAALEGLHDLHALLGSPAHCL